jgi:hypothetical protein
VYVSMLTTALSIEEFDVSRQPCRYIYIYIHTYVYIYMYVYYVICTRINTRILIVRMQYRHHHVNMHTYICIYELAGRDGPLCMFILC